MGVPFFAISRVFCADLSDILLAFLGDFSSLLGDGICVFCAGY